MKKLLTTASTTALFLASAPSALAANINVNPCPTGIRGGDLCGNVNASSLLGSVFTWLFIIGALIAIIFLIWGGIKWITAGGDKTKVQAARDTIIGAIIGLIIVFASYFIIAFVLKILFDVDLNQLNLPTLGQ